MRIYALDTNIISFILKENPNVLSHVRQELKARNKLIIPPLAYYEVRRGLLSVDTPVLTPAFNRFCAKIPVGKMSNSELDEAARIYAALKKKGRLIEDADILIAAYCIVNGYTLVTNNTKHFENVDNLLREDWTE